jgi:integrase
MHNDATTTPERPARRARKRGDGEGTINQRADGLWRAQLMIGTRPDGKPDRRAVYGKTRADVQRKLDELRRRAQGGTLGSPQQERATLAAFLGRWLEAIRPNVRPTTHKVYADLLRLHVMPTLGSLRLSALRPSDLQRLYARLLEQPLASGQPLATRTVKHVHVVLHGALKQAVKWGEAARNVCDAVDPPRVVERELHAPTPEELASLLDAATDDALLPLWTLAVYTGARQGELLGLQWQDVDLVRGTITIQRTLLQSTKGGVPAYAPPKTKRSRRTVTLPAEAVSALRTHRQRQLADRVLLGPDYAPYDLVFATSLGTPYGARNIGTYFKRVLVRAGLPSSIRFHDLRHGAATTMLAAGVPLKVASERLGHATTAITADPTPTLSHRCKPTPPRS